MPQQAPWSRARNLSLKATEDSEKSKVVKHTKPSKRSMDESNYALKGKADGPTSRKKTSLEEIKLRVEKEEKIRQAKRAESRSPKLKRPTSTPKPGSHSPKKQALQKAVPKDLEVKAKKENKSRLRFLMEAEEDAVVDRG